jgi:hypothetical protein
MVTNVVADPVANIATRIGADWVVELVTTLRAQRRAVAGAWPGTMREARSRVVVALGGTYDRDELEACARSVYSAARSQWAQIAEPDEE